MRSLNLTLELIQTLPSVPLEFRELIPETSGLYFAVAPSHIQPILYIGKAQNIQERWKSHHRLRDLQVVANIGIPVSLAWLDFAASDEILYQQETCLIQQFRPPLNNLPSRDAYLVRLEGRIALLESQARTPDSQLAQLEEKVAALEEKTKVLNLAESEPQALLAPSEIKYSNEAEIALLEGILSRLDSGDSADKVAKWVKENFSMGYPRARAMVDTAITLLQNSAKEEEL